jgi:hypothetical protein
VSKGRSPSTTLSLERLSDCETVRLSNSWIPLLSPAATQINLNSVCRSFPHSAGDALTRTTAPADSVRISIPSNHLAVPLLRAATPPEPRDVEARRQSRLQPDSASRLESMQHDSQPARHGRQAVHQRDDAHHDLMPEPAALDDMKPARPSAELAPSTASQGRDRTRSFLGLGFGSSNATLSGAEGSGGSAKRKISFGPLGPVQGGVATSSNHCTLRSSPCPSCPNTVPSAVCAGCRLARAEKLTPLPCLSPRKSLYHPSHPTQLRTKPRQFKRARRASRQAVPRHSYAEQRASEPARSSALPATEASVPPIRVLRHPLYRAPLPCLNLYLQPSRRHHLHSSDPPPTGIAQFPSRPRLFRPARRQPRSPRRARTSMRTLGPARARCSFRKRFRANLLGSSHRRRRPDQRLRARVRAGDPRASGVERDARPTASEEDRPREPRRRAARR